MKISNFSSKVVALALGFFLFAFLFESCCTQRYRLSADDGEISFFEESGSQLLTIDTLTGPFSVSQRFNIEIIASVPSLMNKAMAFSCDENIADEISELNNHFSIDKSFFYKAVNYPAHTNWYEVPALEMIKDFKAPNNFAFDYNRVINFNQEFLDEFQIENGEVIFEIKVETLFENEIKMEQSVILNF